jgi:hypothetical protein
MFEYLVHKLVLIAFLFMTVANAAEANEVNVVPAPNGIEIPKGYQYWQLIGVSHRTDKDSLRAILGNSIAAKASAEGKTNPWPEGAILAKLAWKDSIHPEFPAATVPGELAHVEFMIKDTSKFPDTNGWGFARWLGMEKKPYGKDAGFEQECSTCHLQAKNNGYVFTRRAPLP